MKAQKRARLENVANAANLASAPPPVADVVAAGQTLKIDLIGRICLATWKGRHAALFLDVPADEELGIRKHSPILRAAVDDVTQEGADLAVLTLADGVGRVQAVWNLAGYDMHFEGLASKKEPEANIQALTDLQAAYRKVDPDATWRSEDLFDPKRLPKGIAARLWLRGFDRLDSMDFDGAGQIVASSAANVQRRTFLPGGHEQHSDSVVRGTAAFSEFDAGRPTLVLTNLTTGAVQRVPFDDTTPFHVTFSNLCTCVGNDPNVAASAKASDGTPVVLEDDEFAVYYELLEQPPAQSKRPVPFVAKQGAGAGGVAQCVPMSKLP